MKKGGQSLLHGGYRYTKIRKSAAGMVYWRCADRSCPGRTITNGGQLEKTSGEHHHPPNPSGNKVEEIKSRMRKRAREETRSIPTIYNDVLQGIAINGGGSCRDANSTCTFPQNITVQKSLSQTPSPTKVTRRYST